MASLSQAKTLGGVGSILVLLGAIPNVGFVLAIVGFILILVAVKNVSESVNEPGIFNDMIIAWGPPSPLAPMPPSQAPTQ
jgi:uncharacterized membrane protein